MKTNIINTPQSQLGLSLIELLIAMVIALILMTGVLKIYETNFKTNRYQENLALVQEAGRYAMERLTNQVRMSSYSGCMSDKGGRGADGSSPKVDVLVDLPGIFQPKNGIEGWDAGNGYGATIAPVTTTTTGTTTPSNGDGGAPFIGLVGSDALQVWGTSGGTSRVTSVADGAGTATILLKDKSALALPGGNTANKVLIVSDCTKTFIVQSCADAGTGFVADGSCAPGNIEADKLANLKVETATVAPLSSDAYFVARRNGNGPVGLWSRPLSDTGAFGTPVEIVEGVENMQVYYGISTTDTACHGANQYVPANLLREGEYGDFGGFTWNNVVSVRINLLVQSREDFLVDAPIPYQFNGVTVTPTDRRIRQSFTRTFTLRNRTLGEPAPANAACEV